MYCRLVYQKTQHYISISQSHWSCISKATPTLWLIIANLHVGECNFIFIIPKEFKYFSIPYIYEICLRTSLIFLRINMELNPQQLYFFNYFLPKELILVTASNLLGVGGRLLEPGLKRWHSHSLYRNIFMQWMLLTEYSVVIRWPSGPVAHCWTDPHPSVGPINFLTSPPLSVKTATYNILHL